MSWEEKIRELEQQEEEIKQRDLKRISKEQDFCIDVLKQLHCEEKLAQIRDEIWQAGKVSIGVGTIEDIPYRWYMSDRKSLFYEVLRKRECKSGVATLSLSIVWPVYVKSCPSGRFNRFGDQYWYPPYIEGIEKSLSIIVGFRDLGKFALIVVPDSYRGGFFKYDPRNGWTILIPEDSQPEEELEKYLAMDCRNRQGSSPNEALPYALRKAEGETRAVKELLFNPDQRLHIKHHQGIEYILELAEKARLEKK
jgi:hypothetical protein